MLTSYPQVPTGWDLGVGCAVQSYDGKLFFGFIADTVAAPDVDRLRDFVAQSFEELRHSAMQKKARGAKKAKEAAQKDVKGPVKPVQAAAREPEKTESVQAAAASVAAHTGEAA